MTKKDMKHLTDRQKQVVECFNKNGGNVSHTAAELGVARQTVQNIIRKTGWAAKPIAAGQLARTEAEVLPNPPAGRIRRYLLTSAQNNTFVNERMWKSLNSLACHYDAAVMVGTYSYNTNAYGAMAVKRGKKHEVQRELWFDKRLDEHIVDSRIELGNGLVWCGEMNIIPTAANPLMGLETYSHRKSAIFPHAKLAMRSIATMQGEGAKLNYTTGTVTVNNYIQKREGLIAEHHHAYAALLVEVNDAGNWWVRQVHCDDKGRMQDLDVVADGDGVTTGNEIEAINWGDLHATMVEPWVMQQSLDMLDTLKPKYQFLHDVMEGASINRHVIKNGAQNNPHYNFYRWLRGLHRVDAELSKTVGVLDQYMRPWCVTVVPDSNHDGWWLHSWLDRFDYRVDPANAELFLKLQTFMYERIRGGQMPRDVNLTKKALEMFGAKGINFLIADESFKICDGRIECGMHGHLGPDGARGTPSALSKIGRRANIGHVHSAGIYNGLYVAGTSSKLTWDYNFGPSSWNHSHIITYPNGSRTIVTMYDGCWKA